MAKSKTRARTARKKQQDGTVEGKNPNGAGTVFERSDGRWCAQLVTVDEAGKKWRRTFYARSEREVRAKLREAQTGLDQNRPQPARYGAAARRVTVSEYLSEWLDRIATSTRPRAKSPGTMRKYRQLVRDYIEPELGSLLLSRVSTKDIQRFYDHLGDHLSSGSVDVVHAILHKAFEAAALAQPPEIPFNPVVTKVLSRSGREDSAERGEQDHLSKEQVGLLLEAAAQPRFARWRAAVTLAVMTGMRRGELLALKWDDVDLSDTTITVRASLKPVEGGGMTLGTTKSAAGTRVLAFGPTVSRALAEHWKLQLAEREQAGELWQNEGFVIANEFGRYCSPSTLRRRWDDILKAAELPPMDIKSARHGVATLMDAANVPLKVRATQMGHSDERMTMTNYTHADLERQRAAADAVDALVRRQMA